MNDCSRTHGARFKRDKKRATDQTVVAKNPRGLPHGYNLGVPRRIAIAQDPVLAPCDDCAVVDKNSADRHLACFRTKTCLGESNLHHFLIGDHAPDGKAAGCCCVMQCSAPSPQIRSTL